LALAMSVTAMVNIRIFSTAIVMTSLHFIHCLLV